MHCTIQCFPQGQLAKKALTLEQLLSVYEKISALPIIEAFIALSALSTQITSIIDGLKQQDGSPDFSQWLKNNWVVLPIMAGVVAIRVAQYFLKPEGSPVDATS